MTGDAEDAGLPCRNVMCLIVRRRPCINGMHRGIDCRRKYNSYFTLESQKQLVSAKYTAYQQHKTVL